MPSSRPRRARGCSRPARRGGLALPARTSRRPACCAPSARCGRSPRQAAAHGAGRRARSRRDPRPAAARLDDGRVLEADVGRVGVRRLARADLPASSRRSRPRGRSSTSSPAARPGASRACRPTSTTTAPSTAQRDLDGLGVKAAVDHDGPPLDPDAPLPPASAARRGRRACARRGALPRPGARRPARAAPRRAATSSPPTRHFIAAPHPAAPVGLAAGRRLGPRLQARARAGRAPGRQPARRRADARPLLTRAARPRAVGPPHGRREPLRRARQPFPRAG